MVTKNYAKGREGNGGAGNLGTFTILPVTTPWIGLCSVVRPCQHRIGYGRRFLRPDRTPLILFPRNKVTRPWRGAPPSFVLLEGLCPPQKYNSIFAKTAQFGSRMDADHVYGLCYFQVSEHRKKLIHT